MDVLENIRKSINEELPNWDQPSIAVGIVKDGQVVLAEGFGYADVEKEQKADAETLYQIGSCSKAFTAAAAALLVDQGKLEWDKPVHDYLPWVEFKDPYTTMHATVRDLLCHRTGLPRHDAYWKMCIRDRYEAMLMIRRKYGFAASNIALTEEEKLNGRQASRRDTVLDLGDDEFTVGKPHPMIEPSLREERLLQEALDPETAVILVDVEIGYGSHENPAKVLAEEIGKAKAELAKAGRTIVFVASICGSKEDFQDYEKQKSILEEQGVLVADSNARAVELAIAATAKREV